MIASPPDSYSAWLLILFCSTTYIRICKVLTCIAPSPSRKLATTLNPVPSSRGLSIRVGSVSVSQAVALAATAVKAVNRESIADCVGVPGTSSRLAISIWAVGIGDSGERRRNSIAMI